MAQRRGHKIQRLIRQDKGIGDQARLVHEGERLPCVDVDHPDAAALGQRPFGDGDAAEDGALAHLRPADEGQRAATGQAAREAGQFAQGFVFSRGGGSFFVGEPGSDA
jgi:hypothetical protein